MSDPVKALSPEEQARFLSEMIVEARRLLESTDDAVLKLRCLNTLGALNKELNNVQRALFALNKTGRARRVVTDVA